MTYKEESYVLDTLKEIQETIRVGLGTLIFQFLGYGIESI